MIRLIVPTLLLISSMMLAAQDRRGRGMVDSAPAIGDPIPKVSAKGQSDGKWVAFNKPKKLTVLVFGSHT